MTRLTKDNLPRGSREAQKEQEESHQTSPGRGRSQISILRVEDNQQMANLVNDVLASAKWRVELCADGYGALNKLTGNDHYDLLFVDHDSPELSGLEFIKRARTISPRRRTPILMLSGRDCEAEAWRANGIFI